MEIIKSMPTKFCASDAIPTQVLKEYYHSS